GTDGRRHRAAFDASSLFRVLEAGDLEPALHARFPGAVVAARHGDPAPVLRLAQLTALAGLGAVEAPTPAREDSLALRLATVCSDIRFPWRDTDSADARVTALTAAVRAVPADALFPFDQ